MPTSKDVAAAAGVSQSTVSYVMSGKRPISEKTRKRVEAAMEKLTYQPNAGARALASRRTRVIGLVIPFIPELHMSSIMEFIAVIAATARQLDHDILLVTDDEGAAGLQRVVGQQLCDGLILMQVEGVDNRIPVVRSLGVPVVLIGIPQQTTGLNCVDADFEQAGALCITDLADAGHRSICIVNWQTSVVERHVNYVQRFHEGVRSAALDRKVQIVTVAGNNDRAGMAAAVDEGLAGLAGAPAFVCPDAGIQELLLDTLRIRGLTPGTDVSVIGGCSAAVAERQIIPLSTIDLQPATVSRRAVQILCAILAGQLQQDHECVELISPVIVHRDSTIKRPDVP
ncbi:LacI family DNA-binding transcriptional regulator [Specibacter cremeus]|uniref:LacI family DNA-binding transcriptional regulator n=1 Tax=Specibacter cremeus TaxID=1629051 RepID=UPI000F76687C|nr:LacI family DNA-binding transcriptional regulator [Specibacter cremeus]